MPRVNNAARSQSDDPMNPFSSSSPKLLSALALGLLCAGCTLAPSVSEKRARTEVAQIGDSYRPGGRKPALPEPTLESTPADYIHFAVLNNPKVEAAYDEWRASVDSIAPARALPDPQLTFQADVWNTLMSFMPGLMFDVMSSGKRMAMARELTASGNVAYRAYVATVLRTAAGARKAWIELVYVEEVFRLRERALGELKQSLDIANAGYATGRGMGSLVDQVRVSNEASKVRVDLAILADRRVAARARLKSALGLAPSDPDPAWPQADLGPTPLPTEDVLWRRAQAANPDLGRMRAMVEMAVAGVAVARTAGTPDFSLGGMVNVLNTAADPRMIRPVASVTLPVWREKIAAGIAAAKALRDASAARVTAEQIDIAAELAQMLFMVHEADRRIAYIDNTELPSFTRTIATVEAGYQSGETGPGMIPETQLMALTARLERAAALRQREIAATDLMLLTADVVPPGAPLLDEARTPVR